MSELIKPQPIEVFGDDDHIAGLVRRMRYMIPGASNAPDAIVWKAAQIATIHRLDPFSGDIHVYSPYRDPKSDQWIVDVGISAWRRVSQRQARYSLTFCELAAEEVRQHRGEDYDPGDVGYECTLYRLDVARECQNLGIPYEATKARGFWRVKAWWDKFGKVWSPDTLPNTCLPADVAQRRAEKKALKQAFSLDFPDEQPATGWHLANRERQIETEERLVAPVARPEISREANGDIMFA